MYKLYSLVTLILIVCFLEVANAYFLLVKGYQVHKFSNLNLVYKLKKKMIKVEKLVKRTKGLPF